VSRRTQLPGVQARAPAVPAPQLYPSHGELPSGSQVQMGACPPAQALRPLGAVTRGLELCSAHGGQAAECNVHDRATGLRIEEKEAALIVCTPEVPDRNISACASPCMQQETSSYCLRI